MNRRNLLTVLLLCLGLLLAGGPVLAGDSASLAVRQQLGRKLFFDTRLSQPAGQACASCHAPRTGFSDPQHRSISPGIIPGRFGNRNAPAVSYAAYSPVFHFDADEAMYIGGHFLDGRAATLEAQARGPLLNPLEMANHDIKRLVAKVRAVDYANLFYKAFGKQAFRDEATTMQQITTALAAYERSAEVNPFNSRYDAWLAGKARLSPQELRGLEVFEAEDKGNCAACHPSRPAPDGSPPLFTDFSYDNLGVPRNPDNPFYRQAPRFNPAGADYVDPGLGQTTGRPEDEGKFKVPTLRNIALSAPYMHNGVFRTLKEVVDFYNTRDTDRNWPAPEVQANVNRDELGDLGLNEQEVEDLIAFLKTLSDAPVTNAARPTGSATGSGELD
jgi:cytochrome c peroxidase